MHCDMKPLLRAIKRLSYFFVAFLIINFVILGLNTYLVVENVDLTVKNIEFISKLDNKIEVIKLYQQQTINKIFKLVKDIAETAIDNDSSQLSLVTKILANLAIMQGTQERIIQKSKETLTIDVPNREDILEANFKITNIVRNTGGSGTHIKLKGASYILTCAHLINNVEEEFLMAQDNEGYYFGMELIKIDRQKDLALFIVKGIKDYPYFEISDIAPTEGSDIIVIGNPDGMVDVISDGVIAKVEKDKYVITNTIFFGSSGGAVLYKGKVAGILSELMSMFFVTYGRAIKLDTIQEFLGDYR